MLECPAHQINDAPSRSGTFMSLRKKLSPTLKVLALLITFPSLLTACSSGKPVAVKSKASSKDLYLISHPSKSTLNKVNSIIPHAVKWYGEVEKQLYAKGRPLTAVEKKEAKQLGVIHPDAVRVVILDKFPVPDAESTTNNHFEGARAMGNIIMIKPRHQHDSQVLCHELVHIAQKDRMGLHGFLKQYALEREVLGYSRSLLENEAYALQHEIK